MPAVDSPTADLPGYIPKFDPKEDPKEDDDEDPEEDPADYPTDGGDDGDDEDEPSDDDEDEEVDIKADDEEEKEHPAPADSTAVALPAADRALFAEETKPFETDESAATPPPHPAYRITARISIPAPVPTPVWSGAEVAKLLAISTPPSSPLSPWSSPLPPIPSASLPVSSPLLVSSPVPVLGITLGPAYEVGESSSAAATRPTRGLRADYGFVAIIDREIRRDLERDGRSMDVGDLAHAEVMSLRTIVLAQQSQIRELQSADRRRQMVITEMLAADHMRQKQLTEALKLIKRLQTQMTEFER
ncbi:hypothetical protein Tco_0238447 [Tanacetum coccineum]